MDLQTLIEDERGPLVARLTGVLSGDRHAAEDLAQETLIRAWQRLPEGLDASRRRAWLARTARNLAIDELRRRSRRRSRARRIPWDCRPPSLIPRARRSPA